MRDVKDIIKDIKITAYRVSECIYINFDMLKELIERMNERYYEVQSDIFDDLDDLINIFGIDD